MGMLTEYEMLTALAINLNDKEYWTVKSTYPLDQEYAEVVSRAVKVYQKVKYDAVLEKMCDRYCKYLATINGNCTGKDYTVNNVNELERHCEECPLKLLFSDKRKEKHI